MAQSSQGDRLDWLITRMATRRAVSRCALAAIPPGWPRGGSSPGVTQAQEMIPLPDDAFTYSWRDAAAWLVDQQLPDGGFPGPSGKSDPETTSDAVMAAYALESRISFSGLLAKARDYLLAQRAEYAAMESGQVAKLVMAFIVLDEDLEEFLGIDPFLSISDPECVILDWIGSAHLAVPLTSSLATPTAGATPGLHGYSLRDHALVLIAYGATSDEVPDAALELMRVTQAESGGWAVDGSIEPGAADATTTALVLQALAVADHWRSPTIRRGLRFLRTLRVPEGGFASSGSEPLVADAVSTALVIQATIAADKDSTLLESENAPQALARFQAPSGGFRSVMSDHEPDLQATLQAVLAMEGRYLPVRYACAS